MRKNNYIPYCGKCKRMLLYTVNNVHFYYCSVLVDTPMKGIITPDIDGTTCVKSGLYVPLEE